MDPMSTARAPQVHTTKAALAFCLSLTLLSCSNEAEPATKNNSLVAAETPNSAPPTVESTEDGPFDLYSLESEAENANAEVFQEDLDRGQSFEDVHETGTINVRETSLGKVGDGYFQKNTVVSEDGRSVAWVRLDNENSGVFLNGERVGESFKLFGTTGIVVSPDGKRAAYTVSGGSVVGIRVDDQEFNGDYIGVSRGGLVFSPDSQRFGFVAANGDGQFVTIDGVKGPVFDGISARGITFSPDSKRVAHAGLKGEEWFVVIDGEKNGPWEKIGEQGVLFSPDGTQVAFAARRDMKWHVVHDGKDMGPYSAVSQMTFSPVGGRFAFNAELEKGSWVVMLDGEQSEVHEGLSSRPTFSADGEHFAYSQANGQEMQVVVDGKRGPSFDRMSRKGKRLILLNDDASHVAYVGKRGKEKQIIVDGEVVGSHGTLFQRTIQFFPNSTDVLYVASRSQNSFLHARGQEYGPYPKIIQDTEVINEDGSSFAFGVRDGRQQFVVANGEEGDRYAYLHTNLYGYTPEGKLFYVGRRGKDIYPVLHRVGRGRAYDEIPRSSKLVFNDAGNPEFVAMRGGEFFLVEVLLNEGS